MRVNGRSNDKNRGGQGAQGGQGRSHGNSQRGTQGRPQSGQGRRPQSTPGGQGRRPQGAQGANGARPQGGHPQGGRPQGSSNVPPNGVPRVPNLGNGAYGQGSGRVDDAARPRGNGSHQRPKRNRHPQQPGNHGLSPDRNPQVGNGQIHDIQHIAENPTNAQGIATPKTSKKSKLRTLILGKEKPFNASPEEYKAYKRSKNIRKIIAGILIIALVLMCGTFIYKRFINPEINVVPEAQSGAVALENWQGIVNSGDFDAISGALDPPYLGQERDYVNSSKDKLEFVKTVYSTVDYKVAQVEQRTVYGDVVKDANGKPVMEPSNLMEDGEKVSLTTIDWDHIQFSDEKVKAILAEYKLDVNDPDVSHKLEEAFAAYIVSESKQETSEEIKSLEGTAKETEGKEPLPGMADVSRDSASSDGGGAEPVTADPLAGSSDGGGAEVDQSGAQAKGQQKDKVIGSLGNLPLKQQEWEPSMETVDIPDPDNNKRTVEARRVSAEEDARLDDVIFGGKDFLRAQTRFSMIALGGEPSKEWTAYITASPDDEPTPRPGVGNYRFIQCTWVGAHELQVGIVEEAAKFDMNVQPVIAPVGDGSKENPAGKNTSVLTNQYVTGADGKVTANPIRVELVSFYRDQDAFNFFQSKDTRNRGFTTASQVKYAGLQFKVTNLSNTKLTIGDNSSMADGNLNLTKSTGSMFGLVQSVTLNPGETGIVDAWVASPNLDNMYIIWGKDFKRGIDPVWFRVLSAEDGSVEVKDIAQSSQATDIVEGSSDNGEG